jgi:hypothetical protein
MISPTFRIAATALFFYRGSAAVSQVMMLAAKPDGH